MTKLLSILFVLLWLSTAMGAELPYTFETLNVSIPGGPGQLASPMDIDDQGRILTIINRDNVTYAVASPASKIRQDIRFKDQPWSFISCTGIPFADTMGISITNGVVVGACVDAPRAPSKQFGFVKPLDGQLQLIDFPGANGTMVTGRSSDGKLVGQFYGPLNQNRGALAYRFHCWTLVNGVYKQIDYPVPNTYVSCDAINNKGQILMYYNTVTDQNETIEQGTVIYDNGIVTPLGLSFEHIGGPATYISDMNEDGAVIGLRWNTGNSNQVFLWDDGLFFDIKFPAGWVITELGGINNREEFVGTYLVQTGIDPFYNRPIYERHGFVAIPGPVKVAKGKGGK